MSSVVVYTKPACIPCKLTKKHLDKLGVAYKTAPLDGDILKDAIAAGITAAPLVFANGAIWGGYRPDRLDALKGVNSPA
jgi:glutaredoxin-like protein NrdH